jgi:hypothetical protein
MPPTIKILGKKIGNNIGVDPNIFLDAEGVSAS